MKYTLAVLGLATSVLAKGVTENISPDASAPSGCSTSYDGTFEISVRSFAKRDLVKRECAAEGALVMTLANGVLLDAKQRTGYIASNYQFQFDKPAQAGAIYTAGFSACSNSSLALGGSAVWYQCLSGNFYNLYDRHWAKQCEAVVLQMVPCNGGNPGAVSQIGDGQIQAPTGVPAPVVSQIDDGQIQVPPSAPPVVSQIGDGQIQAPTGAAPQPAPPKVTQISDGQIQAPTSAAPPVVSQISDGQIQAPTGSAPPPTVAPPPVASTPAVVPGSRATKTFPGTMGAMVVALIGFALFL